MLTWLLVNISLSMLALLFIRFNDTAPHRLRFHTGFAALLAWLLPWPFLAPVIPAAFKLQWWPGEQPLADTVTALSNTPVFVVLTPGAAQASELLSFSLLELCFLALLVTGLTLFIWNWITHTIKLQALAQDGKNGNWLWQNAGIRAAVPIIVQQEIAGAFSSGILRPRIWIHQTLTESAQLHTLLHHELTHIKQFDNSYLLFITLVEKLFWWNPLVWLLGNRTREMQELSCDEKCQCSIADYPARLAELMLDCARLHGKPVQYALSANIFNNPNPNIKRIKLLERSYTMKPRHFVSISSTLVTAVFTIGFVTAQTPTADGTVEKRVVIIEKQGAHNGAAAANGTPTVHRIRIGGAGDSDIDAELAELAATAPTDQVLKVTIQNEEQQISFNFTDVSLAKILSPLAELSSQVAMAAELHAQAAVTPGDHQAVKIVALRKQHDGTVDMPISSNLKLEFAGAGERLVTVSGEKLSLSEALGAISAASECNIFEDGDTIVVDRCN